MYIYIYIPQDLHGLAGLGAALCQRPDEDTEVLFCTLSLRFVVHCACVFLLNIKKKKKTKKTKEHIIRSRSKK